MAVDVTFYYFQKKINSTARPSDGNTVSCELRDGSDKYSPNLEIRGIAVNTYNYMYIPLFGRYYYIDKCTWNAEQYFWVVTGTVDVLTTFAPDIMNTYDMIIRSDSLGDPSIQDSLAVTKGRTSKLVNYLDTGALLPNFTSNMYECLVVCQVAGNGFVAMTLYDYSLLLQNFFKQNAITTGDYWTIDIARLVMNPASHFISQMGFPMNINNLVSDNFHPQIGGYEITEVTAHRLAQSFITYSDTVTAPYHPQCTDGNLNNYLNYAPYMSHKAYVGGFGDIPLDSSKITPGENIRVELTVDFLDGGAKIKFINAQNQNIGYSVAQMGFPLAMATRQPQNFFGAISNALAGAGVGGVATALGGLATGMAQALVGSGSVYSSGSTGGCGGWADFNTSKLISEARYVKFPDSVTMGKAYYQRGRIGDFSGFVQCGTGIVSCGGNHVEKEEIRKQLTGGVYIE